MNVTAHDDLPYRPCVGIVVFNRNGQVWAGHRLQNSETPISHLWQFPQGGIDSHEDALVAAKRELFEETGMRSISLLAESADWLKYDLPTELLGKALKGKYRGQMQRWFAFRFDGNESEINISEPADGSKPEFDKWEWKNLSEMPGLIVPFKRDLYDTIVAEFAEFSEVSG